MPPKQFFIQLFSKVRNHHTADLAAQLAYYFLLSVFPLLLFVLTLLPYFSLNSNEVVDFIKGIAPGDAGKTISNIVHTLLSHPRRGLLSFGFLATMWTASSGVSALIRSLNLAYEVKETRSFIKGKLLALVLTIAMVVMIVMTLLLPVFGEVIFNALEFFLNIPSELVVVFHVMKWLIWLTIVIFVMMVLYHVGPNESFKLRDVFWGALVATVGWIVISFGFSFYVSNFAHYASTYGALGGVIIMMVWFYLTGFILVLGGQVNATRHQLKNEQ